MAKIINLDLTTNYYLKKPSSGWVLAGLPNVEIHITYLPHSPIGGPLQLPAYLQKRRSIIALTHKRGKPYLDNKCFFRCVAIHQGSHVEGCEKDADRIMNELETHTERNFKNGVLIGHIPALEVFLKIGINIYELHEDESCDVLYLSTLPLKPMHLNLYKNHFSYIQNIILTAKGLNV